MDWFIFFSDFFERDIIISLVEAVLFIFVVVISDYSESLEDVAEDSYCLDSGIECRLILRRNVFNSFFCFNDFLLSFLFVLFRIEFNVFFIEIDEEILVEIKFKVRLYIDVFFIDFR